MQETVTTQRGLRETKKLATRRALTAAARELAVRHGLDAVTVEMICEQVGVSIRTFFNYFESKDIAILGEDLPVATQVAQLTFLAGGPTGELLPDLITLLNPSAELEGTARAELTTMLSLMMAEPRVLALQLGREVDREQQIARLIASRRGLAEPDLTCTTAAAVAQTAVRRACIDWFHADDGQSIAGYLDRTVDTLRDLIHR